MEYLEDNKMSQHNRYSANHKKGGEKLELEPQSNARAYHATKLKSSKEKSIESNILTPIDHGMRQNVPHFRNRPNRDSQNNAQLEQLGSHQT